jgi:prolipoprotein diacylglyceryltransferase
MQIIVLIPAFILFLYYIYKLVKDDYVFIRKNISLEQIFDITFIVTWIGLFFARLFYFIFNPQLAQNIFFNFFSANISGLSLFGGLVGGAGALYLIGKYKKIPLGRLFDFFTLALVVALPLGFLGAASLTKDFALLAYLGNAVVYFIFALFCVKYVHPKLTSRELKEGNLQVVFLVFLAVVLLINGILLREEGKIVLITIENSILLIFLLFSLVLFIRQAKDGFVNKKR